jgi:hypothetical protein
VCAWFCERTHVHEPAFLFSSEREDNACQKGNERKHESSVSIDNRTVHCDSHTRKKNSSNFAKQLLISLFKTNCPAQMASCWSVFVSSCVCVC